MRGRPFQVLLVGLAVCALAPRDALALTLDWNLNPWPGTGDRTATYSVDGEDVIITVLEPVPVIQAGGFGPGSLSTNAELDPPSNAGADSLFIKTDDNTLANTGGQYVTVDILFTHTGGVTDVAFSFFDVDLMPLVTIFGFPVSGFTDELMVTASDGVNPYDPSSVTALSATPSWSFDNVNTITGTTESASDSDDGTVQVRFDQVINRVTFNYRNTLDQGQLQWIGLSTISFRRSPEPSTGLLLGFGLLLLAARRRSG
jgi:hypothetical protein